MADPDSIKVFGHRGGRIKVPENTLAAFAAALQAGAEGIELDVQRCASGELVVIHDHDLSRTTNGTGRVIDHTLSALKKLSAGKRFAAAFEKEKVPTLIEVLDLVDGNALVNIELKNAPVSYPGIEEDLLRTIAHYKYPDRLIVSSFDHKLLKIVSEKSDLAIAVLAACTFYHLAGYAAALNARYWHPEFSVLTADAVAEAHEAGCEVNTWVVNGVDQWRSAIEMGVDGIFTDDPEGLRSFLDQLALPNEAQRLIARLANSSICPRLDAGV